MQEATVSYLYKLLDAAQSAAKKMREIWKEIPDNGQDGDCWEETSRLESAVTNLLLHMRRSEH